MKAIIEPSKKGALLALTLTISSSFISSDAISQIPVFATQITEENAHALISTGPDAIGGVNDWFFTNGTLCGVVSDVDHEGQLSTKGGSLIDLGFCGRADDHFIATHDLLNASQKSPLDAVKIDIEHNKKSANVNVYSKRKSVELRTRYSLNVDKPSEVHIVKKLINTKGKKLNLFTSVNFNYHSLEPFIFNSKDQSFNRGFDTEDIVSRGFSAIRIAAHNADTIITTSPPTADIGISYGWQLRSAQRVEGDRRYDLPHFALADDTTNAMLILSDTFYLGTNNSIGWLQLPQIPLLSLDHQSAIETHEVIYVGMRGDVAAITDQIFSEAPLINGHINEASSALHILTEDGAPFTFVRPDTDGHFSFRAPQGRYSATIKGSAERQVTHKFSVEESMTLDTPSLPAPAKILLPKGHAMRLLFVGINGTKSPDFTNRLTGFSVNDAEGRHLVNPVPNVFLAGVSSDIQSVDLAPGDYQIYATKGPEYSLEKTTIKVLTETTSRLNIDIPKQVVSSPNYIASDLHVHSGISFDNAFSETERVRTFVAEHGEVMVSSEHDVPVDFSPNIAALGVSDKITSIAAVEVTSALATEKYQFTSGHANFFPYVPTPYAYRRGMINHEDKRWREIIHDIKQQQGDEILVQLNHARLTSELSGDLPKNWHELVDDGHFLDHMGVANHPYDPAKPLHTHPNNTLIDPDQQTGVRDLDFNLMEVINPGGEHYAERIQTLRQDWLSFLKQGEKIVATANSDSHRASEQVAVPRTMVAMTDDRVSHFEQSEFLGALKAGNAYGTTGPLIEVSLSGVQMGGTFVGPRGQLSLKILSADWIPVNHVKIQINGTTVDEYQLNEGSQHNLLIPLAFEKDSFVTIEVSGPATKDYQRVYPYLTPYAFSNPIYVDADADQHWQAPGL